MLNVAVCRSPIWCNPEPGKGTFVGNALPTVTTQQQCQDECVKDKKCISVDWVETGTTGQKCYVLYKEDGSYPNPLVVHISLKERCPLSKYRVRYFIIGHGAVTRNVLKSIGIIYVLCIYVDAPEKVLISIYQHTECRLIT